MKQTQFVLSLLVFIICISGGCKKPRIEYDNPYGLPNATKTGRGIFACLVNGKPWIAESGIFSIGGKFSKDSIKAGGSYGPDVYFQNFGFIIKESVLVGSENKIDGTNGYFVIVGDHDCTGLNTGYIRHFGKGVVTMTKIDTVNHIISGTFTCKIPVPNCDTLRMTDGRFDIRYH